MPRAALPQESVLPLSSWPGLLSPVFWLLVIVQLVLALGVPETWATENTFARELAIAVRSTLLSVSRHADIGSHANSTSFPNVALLSHAWMWLAMALLLVYNSLAALLHWKTWMDWLPRRIPQVAGTIKASTAAVGVLILLAGPVVFTMMPGSSSIIDHAELGSRVFFAALSLTFLFLWQILAYVWLPILGYGVTRRFFTGF